MNNSLRFRLILFTFILILLTLFVAGVSINVMLVGLHSEKAEHDSEHAYELMNRKIKAVEKKLLGQSQIIAKDPVVIVPVNLVNRYQNIKDYQPLIFDQEKKVLANYLLKRTSIFHWAQAALYDEKGILIAFAAQHDKKIIEGITTFSNNEPVYLIKNMKSCDWQSQALPSSISEKLDLLDNMGLFVSRTGKIEYFANQNNFTLSSIKTIQRKHSDGSDEVIGFIKIIRDFNDHYIKELTSDFNVNVSLKLVNNKFINKPNDLNLLDNLGDSSSLFGSEQIAVKEWLKNDVHYVQSYVLPVVNGKIFIILSQSRAELESALNKSRYILLLIFLFIALLIIPFGIYWLNKRVSGPLTILTKQLGNIEKDEYPEFYLTKSKDEISLLGNGLNNMVEVIKSREEALKASQIDLNEAQHLAKIGSWTLNYVADELHWSDEMYDILELDKYLIKPSYDTFLDVVFSDDKKIVNDTYIFSRKNKQPFDLTHRLQMKSGDIKYIHEHCEFIFDEKENILFCRGTIQDITKQKQNDEVLHRTQKMDALGKVTGGIAHDFNNMLGIIIGYSELLQSMLINDADKLKYIDNVIDAGERASLLTKKLLSFSRKESAIIDSVNINELLIDDRNLLEKTLTSRIELIYELDENLWPVLLDKNDMQNAVLNMSINAMHAMQNFGKLIIKTSNIYLDDIDTKNLNLDAGDYVLLSITDTGIGMDEEVRSKLFDPFFSTKGDKGTGLGMSQVYGFVQQTGGVIHVYSEPGYGTRIAIYLPRNTKDKIESELEQEFSYEYVNSGTETILVVDDEVSLREFAQEVLTKNNYQVLSAENGVEALKILENNPVDMVITDVIMPEMDGYQLATKIHKLYPDIKIQIASGFSDDLSLDIINKKLHQQRLQKPFNSKVLLRKVREVLDNDKEISLGSDFEELSIPIEWSDKFSTGIAQLDSDYKELVNLINKCEQAIRDKQADKIISSILNDLVTYVDYHFKREELLMKVCEYPDFDEHFRQHENLKSNVNEYVREYGNGKLTATSLLNSLLNWLINHIVAEDLTITPFCKGKEKEIEQAFKDAGYKY